MTELSLSSCYGEQTQAQLSATEGAAKASREREAELREREAGALQMHAAAKQQIAMLQKRTDELHKHAQELVEALRAAGCATARCVAATDSTAKSIQKNQSSQVCKVKPVAAAHGVSMWHLDTAPILGLQACQSTCTCSILSQLLS